MFGCLKSTKGNSVACLQFTCNLEGHLNLKFTGLRGKACKLIAGTAIWKLEYTGRAVCKTAVSQLLVLQELNRGYPVF